MCPICEAPIATPRLLLQLGRVAVAGSERKQPGVGVLYVWEWDPIEWLASPTGGNAPGGLAAGSSPRLGQRFSLGRGASGALFASGESRRLSGGDGAATGPGSPQAGGDGDGAATPSSGGPEPAAHGFIAGGGGFGGLLAKHENPLKVLSVPIAWRGRACFGRAHARTHACPDADHPHQLTTTHAPARP
jgi:hypothetical protein